MSGPWAVGGTLSLRQGLKSVNGRPISENVRQSSATHQLIIENVQLHSADVQQSSPALLLNSATLPDIRSNLQLSSAIHQPMSADLMQISTAQQQHFDNLRLSSATEGKNSANLQPISATLQPISANVRLIRSNQRTDVVVPPEWRAPGRSHSAASEGTCPNGWPLALLNRCPALLTRRSSHSDERQLTLTCSKPHRRARARGIQPRQ
jgi:hypothetical protein